MTEPLDPQREMIGAYTGPARVIFHGDPKLCMPAVRRGRVLLGSLRWQMSQSGATESQQFARYGNTFIHVMQKAGMSTIQVYANQQSSAPFRDQRAGYQFIHTGPTTQIVTESDYTVFCGSAVYVPLPRIPESGAVDWSSVKPIATGSMKEKSTDEPPKWDYYPQTAASLDEITRFKNVTQLQLAPEPSFVLFGSNDDKDRILPLAYSQVSDYGQVRMAGSKMMTDAFIQGDVQYDLAPGVIRGRELKAQAPDADWYHDAAAYRITHPEFGTRTFIVMVDASSVFHCWPIQPIEGWPAYDNDPAYVSQAIKTNVDYAQSVNPPFPEWVHVSPTAFRDAWNSDAPIQSPEPRYPYKFHPFIPRVVGIALKRTELADSMVKLSFLNTEGDFVEPNYKAIQVRLGDKLVSGTSTPSTGEKVAPAMDRPGVVEFDLNITITGTEFTDFTFGMSLRSQELAAGTRYPIAAGYLSPVKNDWPSRGIAATGGDLVTAYLENYHDEERDFYNERWCGVFGLMNRMAFLVFRKADTELLRVKLEERSKDFANGTYPNFEGVFDTSWKNHNGSHLNSAVFDLDISQMTFGVHYTYQVITGTDIVVDQRYAYESLAVDVSPPKAQGRLNEIREEVQVRIYHRGQVSVDRSYGTSQGLAARLDDLATGDLILDDVDTISTVFPFINSGFHIPQSTSFSSDNHLYVDFILGKFYEIAQADIDPIAASNSNTSELMLAKFFERVTHTELANLWTGYSVDYFNTHVAPMVENAWQAMRRLSQASGRSQYNLLNMYQKIAFFGGLLGQIPRRQALLRWEDYYSGVYEFRYFPHLYSFPVTEQSYHMKWRSLFASGTAFKLVADSRGFLSLYMPVIYQNGATPNGVEYTIFGDSTFQAWVDLTAGNNTLPSNLSVLANRWSRVSGFVPQPSMSVIAQDIIDVVKHEQGGETSHTALYNIAYDRTLSNEAMKGTPMIEVDTYRYVYAVTWPVLVNGVDYTAFYKTTPTATSLNNNNFYIPRANGAAFFI